MNAIETRFDPATPSLPPAEVFLDTAEKAARSELENKKLSALVRILSGNELVGPYMRMKVSDQKFSSKIQDAVAQARMQATQFARFDAGNARAQISAERRAGAEVSFLDDRGVKAAGEAQLESLFRRKKDDLSLLRGVPVSRMGHERHGKALQSVQLLAASKTMVKYALSHGDEGFESHRAVEFVRFLEILGCTDEYAGAVAKSIQESALGGSVRNVRSEVKRAAAVSSKESSGVIRATLRKIMRALPIFRKSGR